MIIEINEEQRMILRDLLEKEIRYLKEGAIPNYEDRDKKSLEGALKLNEDMPLIEKVNSAINSWKYQLVRMNNLIPLKHGWTLFILFLHNLKKVV